MNNNNLIGNLTKDPHFIAGNKEGKSSVAFLTVANNDDNEAVYIDVTVFGKTAEFANKHLKKGHRVAIEGKLAQRLKMVNSQEVKELYVICKRLTNLNHNKAAGEDQK